MRLESPAFADGSPIPERHTAQGRNTSPALVFRDVPPAARSLVLLAEDAGAAPEPWTHWLVFNIPPAAAGAGEGQVPPGGAEGWANGGTPGYEGPNQVYFSGVHRYGFSLLALDGLLDPPATADKSQVPAAAA